MDDLTQALRDAGCDDVMSEAVRRPCESHQVGDAVRALRRHRCDLMDVLHESQRRVDRLDYLIRHMEERL